MAKLTPVPIVVESLIQAEPAVLGSSASERDQGERVGGNGLRPSSFDDYPGRQQAKENLKVYVAAAKSRGKPLDHVILHGPPGLGKTSLAYVIAKELGVPFAAISGPSIDRPGDLAGILAGLAEGALLFIDEIHRLPVPVEEILYSAMEDFAIDIMIGQGSSARSVRIDIAPFTLVGATTKLSKLSPAFLNRFGIQEKLAFYDTASLMAILLRAAALMGVDLCQDAARSLAERSRGTPRIANRLLRRSIDFAEVAGSHDITTKAVDEALQRLEIDEVGLDRTDRQMIRTMIDCYHGGPVGIEALAVTLGEDRRTLEDVYEPYLIYCGYIIRSPRGRIVTQKGRRHLGTT